MIKLSKTLNAWQTPDFDAVLKTEIESLDPAALPLQQGLSQSSYVSGEKFSVMIINVSDREGFIRVKTGIFYSGVIAGCNCADDPSPVDEQTEYCEVIFEIDKATAKTTVSLSSE